MTLQELKKELDTFKKTAFSFDYAELERKIEWFKEQLDKLELHNNCIYAPVMLAKCENQFSNQNDKIKELIEKMENKNFLEYSLKADNFRKFLIWRNEIIDYLHSLLTPQPENIQWQYCANNHKVSPVWLNCPVCGDTSTTIKGDGKC